ncbi:hypothetical protein SAMN05216567_1324 [Variovorax sp. OK605]|uniref:hypothetical protein n=1 Tax=Variovorax sp. OK605 TaxID=1855317 RepID=UPI0008E6CBFF|nr:hypothetical protein [Variovorax sp. OK605]SFP50465.1 hypothetical protein SAMN05216567_106431 [Variovorax sp. OK605]SFQ55618.1 hypothetical protein SAMN05216567_119157 [Variovorax sp. OK605]SFQ71381.1 hypothetical protein SAMN05216567_1294 [Variovorax sp. OK605]SFQ73450.1 hypothetical protein SAMN05216567_1324 [Variovorax sp. OK605]
MNPQGTDPKLIDALNRATSLELFQLSAIIERMLADPRRIIAVRTNMNLGQMVRFLDWRDGQMRNGKVVAMKDTQVTLHEEGTRREWKLPYAAVEPPSPASATASTPTRPAPLKSMPARGDFRCGEKVSFDDKYLQPQVGIVVRINQRTATVDTGNGHSWRVPFHMLRQVFDI